MIACIHDKSSRFPLNIVSVASAIGTGFDFQLSIIILYFNTNLFFGIGGDRFESRKDIHGQHGRAFKDVCPFRNGPVPYLKSIRG